MEVWSALIAVSALACSIYNFNYMRKEPVRARQRELRDTLRRQLDSMKSTVNQMKAVTDEGRQASGFAENLSAEIDLILGTARRMGASDEARVQLNMSNVQHLVTKWTHAAINHQIVLTTASKNEQDSQDMTSEAQQKREELERRRDTAYRDLERQLPATLAVLDEELKHLDSLDKGLKP